MELAMVLSRAEAEVRWQRMANCRGRKHNPTFSHTRAKKAPLLLLPARLSCEGPLSLMMYLAAADIYLDLHGESRLCLLHGRSSNYHLQAIPAFLDEPLLIPVLALSDGAPILTQ